MSDFPGSPRVLKGAIIGVSKFNPLATVIIFQYNPDQLPRSLRPNAAQTRRRREQRKERNAFFNTPSGLHPKKLSQNA